MSPRTLIHSVVDLHNHLHILFVGIPSLHDCSHEFLFTYQRTYSFISLLNYIFLGFFDAINIDLYNSNNFFSVEHVATHAHSQRCGSSQPPPCPVRWDSIPARLLARVFIYLSTYLFIYFFIKLHIFVILWCHKY